MVFFFEPANITNQILNFGLPAPIDLQIVGHERAKRTTRSRSSFSDRIARIPGAADVHIHQVFEQPQLNLNVDRVKAGQLGLTQRDVTSSMLISLSGNNQVAPSFWLNPANGISYNVGVQTSQYRIDSLDELLRTPMTAATSTVAETTPGSLAGVAAAGNASVGSSPSGVSQAYGNPGAMTSGTTQLLSNLVDVTAQLRPGHHQSLQCRAGVRRLCQRRSPRSGQRWPGSREDHGGGTSRTCRAARRSSCVASTKRCRSSFFRLGLGIVFAVVLVYLLMAVNFQSWLDPFIILTALPGAMAGILWMLFVTGTTLSVPSLMGSIMSIGVATANSILLVTFANDERAPCRWPGGDAVGRVRASAAGADDCGGHDPGHAADGARSGRRRRTECAARPRRDRRTARRDGHDAVRGPDHLFYLRTKPPVDRGAAPQEEEAEEEPERRV